jgi:DNA repair exonuclease SbcCD nuclease subunit
MKIAIITDTHYNFKKANKAFHDYFAKFYNDVFFPILEEREINTVVHMGDAFDNRKGVDYWALEWAKKNVYDRFRDLGITVYNIVGNHDTYFKNSNEINSVDILLKEYENVIPISSIEEFNIGGLDTLMIPWICSDNENQTFEKIQKTKAKVAFGHLELNGFSVFPGQVQEKGLGKDIFNHFDRVFSGHYHTRSNDGKIFYLGNPYQMFWSDVDDKRGFTIFDTKTYELEQINNPNEIFYRIFYDENDDNTFNKTYLKDKIVKIVVRNKTDQLKFDKFIDKVLKSNPLEMKIAETLEIDDEEFNYDETDFEDTLSILNKYVQEVEFDLDKNMVKELIKEVYQEALVLE